MFSITICGMMKKIWSPFMWQQKTFGHQHDWQLKVFCYYTNGNQKHSISIGWRPKFFNRCKLNNQKVFQSPQGLQQLK
jgi:hypothetical protein